MAEKEGILYIPKFDTVILPDYKSFILITLTAYSSGRSFPSLLLAIRPFICVFKLIKPVLSTSFNKGVTRPKDDSN